MTLALESVMSDLTPMLKRPHGRPKKEGCSCACGETDPQKFRTSKSTCTACQNIYYAQRRLRLKEQDDFSRALETLAVINSFPTREALS